MSWEIARIAINGKGVAGRGALALRATKVGAWKNRAALGRGSGREERRLAGSSVLQKNLRDAAKLIFRYRQRHRFTQVRVSHSHLWLEPALRSSDFSQFILNQPIRQFFQNRRALRPEFEYFPIISIVKHKSLQKRLPRLFSRFHAASHNQIIFVETMVFMKIWRNYAAHANIILKRQNSGGRECNCYR